MLIIIIIKDAHAQTSPRHVGSGYCIVVKVRLRSVCTKSSLNEVIQQSASPCALQVASVQRVFSSDTIVMLSLI